MSRGSSVSNHIGMSKSQSDSYMDDVRADAQRTVCNNAIDATDAADLMHMLGIHPDQKTESLLYDELNVPDSVPHTPPRRFR